MPTHYDHKMIDADDLVLSGILRSLVKTFLCCGGFLHPGIRFVAREGHLCVYCDRSQGRADQLLFSLPREALVPIDGIEWDASEVQLKAVSPLVHLTSLQRDLLALHLDAYNTSGKLPWTVRNLSAIALRPHPSLLLGVRALRPGFAKDNVTAAQLFLQTRVFKQESSLVLMPLVDLLNHHPDGAAFQADAKALSVGVAQPGADDECFASYGGRRDVLDLALYYGYADRHTPFACCATLDCDLPELGRLRIAAERRQALNWLDPPKVRFNEEGMTLSHLTCDRRHPHRLHIALRLALLGLAQKRGLNREAGVLASIHAVETIRDSNLRLLQDLQRAAEPLASTVPVAALLKEAAALQADIISEVFANSWPSTASGL